MKTYTLKNIEPVCKELLILSNANYTISIKPESEEWILCFKFSQEMHPNNSVLFCLKGTKDQILTYNGEISGIVFDNYKGGEPFIVQIDKEHLRAKYIAQILSLFSIPEDKTIVEVSIKPDKKKVQQVRINIEESTL